MGFFDDLQQVATQSAKPFQKAVTNTIETVTSSDATTEAQIADMSSRWIALQKWITGPDGAKLSPLKKTTIESSYARWVVFTLAYPVDHDRSKLGQLTTELADAESIVDAAKKAVPSLSDAFGQGSAPKATPAAPAAPSVPAAPNAAAASAGGIFAKHPKLLLGAAAVMSGALVVVGITYKAKK